MGDEVIWVRRPSTMNRWLRKRGMNGVVVGRSTAGLLTEELGYLPVLCGRGPLRWDPLLASQARAMQPKTASWEVEEKYRVG